MALLIYYALLLLLVIHDVLSLEVRGKTFPDVQTALDFIINEGNKELKETVRQLENKVALLEKGFPTKRNVAFSVYPSRHMNNLGPYQHLIFDKIDYISGGGYNANTGVYTCPVSGLYHLTLSLLSSNTRTLFYGQIVVAGSGLGIGFSSYGYFGTHTNIAHCNKGETIILRRLGSHGSGNLHAGKYTNFVGFLLWEDSAQ